MTAVAPASASQVPLILTVVNHLVVVGLQADTATPSGAVHSSQRVCLAALPRSTCKVLQLANGPKML